MAMSVVHLRVNASLNKFRRNAQSCVIFLLTFYFLFFFISGPAQGFLNSVPDLGRKYPEGIIPRERISGTFNCQMSHLKFFRDANCSTGGNIKPTKPGLHLQAT